MDSLVISCPECRKQIRTPANAIGKKIRCKGCEHIFVAQAPGKSGNPVQVAPTKPKSGKPVQTVKPIDDEEAPATYGLKPAKPVKPVDDDEDDGPVQYGVTETSLKPRCPQCAGELEEEQVVCLECGYNTRTRELGRTRKIKYTTGMEKFIWLLPGIGCVLAIFLLLGYCAFHHFALPEIVIGDEWTKAVNEGKKSRHEIIADEKMPTEALLFHAGIEVWVVVFALYGSFKAGRFAFKRLILHPNPPEVETR